MKGSGTVDDPYIIYDVNDLQAVESDPTAYYELANDIDASATIGWNGGLGFDPIKLGVDFTGQLDGRGYVIRELYINRPAAVVGLFYQNAGVIKNLGIENCNLNGAGGQIGPIAGWNTGTIERCWATGQCNGASTSGLVQWNRGASSVIRNCYSRCVVTGTFFTGGLVQWNEGTIETSYFAGGLSSPFTPGGLVQNNGGTVDNCFWDTEVSGQSWSDGGTGKTTAQMKTKSTFTDAGWDFDTIWNIFSHCNEGYPCLRNVTPSCRALLTINRAYALAREEL